ncbi:ATP-binding protein [Streptomyces sp. B6B3]|uniref:ATP-binding protein n=1 Tax=Streptomyces sp. B6B3 TaxID=3153570 RepID=UPI00325F40C4
MTALTIQARRKTERPPARLVLLSLLVSVTATGVGWLGAVYAAPDSFEVPMAWGAGTAAVALSASVATAAYGISRARRLRSRLDAMERDSIRLADETVPALVGRLREGQSADSALAATAAATTTELAGRSLGESLAEQARRSRHHEGDQRDQKGSGKGRKRGRRGRGAAAEAASAELLAEAELRVLRTLAQEVGRSEASRAAAMSACANAAGRMQALATSMLADLRDMEHRHEDEAVLADLLHLDHRTAQAGRLADSIAVLTGARSGRRWPKPIVMESILRGAMGRIGGYRRVRLHSTAGVAVAGHAAEGVMHALAELLDNAANFSPPTAEVHVYVEEVPAGVIVTVEDSGLVMGEVALRRAERAVCREQSLDLTALSGTRLGLAVVGCLARKHGLAVTFRPSARGGTGALLMIPHALLSQPREALPRPPQRPVPSGEAAPVAPVAGPADAEGVIRHVPIPGGRPDAGDTHETHERHGAPNATAAGSGPRGTVVALRADGGAPTDTAAPLAATAPANGGSAALRAAAAGALAAETGTAPEGDRGHDAASGPLGTADHAPLPESVEYSAAGLPKRRRGQALAAAHPDGLPGTERRETRERTAHDDARSLADSAERFRAFRRGMRGEAPEGGETT